MGEVSASPCFPRVMDIDPISTLPVRNQRARLSLRFYWHISPLIWEKIWHPTLTGLPRAALDNLFK